MSEIRDAAVSFEAIKVAMKQDKTGHLLTLRIHPMDVPDEINKSWVGTRYTVAMVELNDQDQPVASEAQKVGPKAVQLAAMLCRDKQFQHWFGLECGAPIFGNDECVQTLRSVLGIMSRAELKDDEEARERLFEIRDSYNEWRDKQ
jgi:hypothetical protein